MSTPFQNRLVGTIIVAAVAIIVLPDVLDGDKKTYQDSFEAIPNKPAVNIVTEKRSFPDEKIASLPVETVHEDTASDDVSAIDQKHLLSEKSTVAVTSLSRDRDFSTETKQGDKKIVAKAEEKLLPVKTVLKQAWVIQLGSFRHQNNVDDLVNKLKKNGYTAFTKPIKTKNGKLTKVFVGPELVKKSLEDKLPSLKKLTNVQGKVARFYPTKS